MSRKRSTRHPAAGQPRPRRRIHEETPPKLRELAACPRCGASYRNGRWTWEKAPVGSYEHVCPACERIASDYPAGVLHVSGRFAAEHRDEVIALLRHLEEAERAQHPLKRIMAVSDEERGFAVTTTDAALVESFGRALKKAYAGELEQPATSAEPGELARVHWSRE